MSSCGRWRLAQTPAGRTCGRLIVSLARDNDYIVAPATTNANNIRPRIAALLDGMMISDISGFQGDDTFVRPVFAGNAFQTVKSSDSKKVTSIRISAFDAAGTGDTVPLETICAVDVPRLSEWVEDSVAEYDRPELTSARVVVSGGRWAGSEEDFALIENLADKLDAAVGTSRTAVDSGYVPKRLAGGTDRQGRCARALCRGGDSRRDPARCWHERQKGDRGHHQE